MNTVNARLVNAALSIFAHGFACEVQGQRRYGFGVSCAICTHVQCTLGHGRESSGLRISFVSVCVWSCGDTTVFTDSIG